MGFCFGEVVNPYLSAFTKKVKDDERVKAIDCARAAGYAMKDL